MKDVLYGMKEGDCDEEKDPRNDMTREIERYVKQKRNEENERGDVSYKRRRR